MIYKTGSTNSVKKVAINKPPITTVAKGFCTSAPEPLLNAIGKKPNDATKAVINTGRNLILVPSNTIFFKSEIFKLPIVFCLFLIVSFFIWLNSAIKTKPFNTATPNKAIKPTPALMLKGIPRSAKKKIPPMADNGMAEKISKPCFTELKAKNNKRNISNNETGTAIINLLFAAFKFSNAPP